ncbi:hypothetical protein ACE1OA_34620 [Streptomyces sp. JL2001]|uniref:hypothetical protein n=1 Tax=unclassified Streptomyces TaxID=2593676 RepID=UPI0036856D2A
MTVVRLQAGLPGVGFRARRAWRDIVDLLTEWLPGTPGAVGMHGRASSAREGCAGREPGTPEPAMPPTYVAARVTEWSSAPRVRPRDPKLVAERAGPEAGPESR